MRGEQNAGTAGSDPLATSHSCATRCNTSIFQGYYWISTGTIVFTAKKKKMKYHKVTVAKNKQTLREDKVPRPSVCRRQR